MDSDKTDQATTPASRTENSGLESALPPAELSPPDVDPATSAGEEDDEARLPELEEGVEAVGEGFQLGNNRLQVTDGVLQEIARELPDVELNVVELDAGRARGVEVRLDIGPQIGADLDRSLTTRAR